MEPSAGLVLLLRLMVLYRTIGVICGARNEESRLVFGTVGGNVTLQLNRDDVEDVSWVYDGGHHRITTKPGEPIKIRDPDHKGNMWATEDASLVIMNLSLEDQKVYTASLQLKGTQESYVIRYDLNVYKILSEEDIHLEDNVTNAEPCRVLLTCVVKEPNVTVTWRNGSGLNITGNVLYIEDVHSNLNITCTAKNPVSNATKAVNPSEFCRGKTDVNTRINHLWVIIVIILLAVTVVVGVTIYLYPRQQSGAQSRICSPSCPEARLYAMHPLPANRTTPPNQRRMATGWQWCHASGPSGASALDDDVRMETVASLVERAESTRESAAAEGSSDPSQVAQVTAQQAGRRSDAPRVELPLGS